MAGIASVVPMFIAAGLVIGFRLWLGSRERRHHGGTGGRRDGVVALIPLLLPLVMIGAAVLGGAFAALETSLGLALAPFMLAGGSALGLWVGSRRSPGDGRDARASNDVAF